jgi:hypothetical protein
MADTNTLVPVKSTVNENEGEKCIDLAQSDTVAINITIQHVEIGRPKTRSSADK